MNISSATLVVFYTTLFFISLVLIAQGDVKTWWVFLGIIVGCILLAELVRRLHQTIRDIELTQPAPQQGTPQGVETMTEVLITFMAALSAFAVAVMVPLTYGLGMDQVTFQNGYVFSFVAYGIFVYGAYIFFNTVSGRDKQKHPILYRIDHWPSLLAWLSLNITLLAIVYRMFANNQEIVHEFQASGKIQLLLGLTVFSWVDVFWNQKARIKDLYGKRLDKTATAADKATGAPSTPPLAQSQGPYYAYVSELGAGPIYVNGLFKLVLLPNGYISVDADYTEAEVRQIFRKESDRRSSAQGPTVVAPPIAQ